MYDLFTEDDRRSKEGKEEMKDGEGIVLNTR